MWRLCLFLLIANTGHRPHGSSLPSQADYQQLFLWSNDCPLNSTATVAWFSFDGFIIVDIMVGEGRGMKVVGFIFLSLNYQIASALECRFWNWPGWMLTNFWFSFISFLLEKRKSNDYGPMTLLLLLHSSNMEKEEHSWIGVRTGALNGCFIGATEKVFSFGVWNKAGHRYGYCPKLLRCIVCELAMPWTFLQCPKGSWDSPVRLHTILLVPLKNISIASDQFGLPLFILATHG